MAIAESDAHGVAANEVDSVGAEGLSDRRGIEQRTAADLVDAHSARAREAEGTNRKSANVIRVCPDHLDHIVEASDPFRDRRLGHQSPRDTWLAYRFAR